MLWTVDWVGRAPPRRGRPAAMTRGGDEPAARPGHHRSPGDRPGGPDRGDGELPGGDGLGRLGEHRREDADHRDADLDDDDPHGAPPVEQQPDRPGGHHADDERRDPGPHHRVVALPGQHTRRTARRAGGRRRARGGTTRRRPAHDGRCAASAGRAPPCRPPVSSRGAAGPASPLADVARVVVVEAVEGVLELGHGAPGLGGLGRLLGLVLLLAGDAVLHRRGVHVDVLLAGQLHQRVHDLVGDRAQDEPVALHALVAREVQRRRRCARRPGSAWGSWCRWAGPCRCRSSRRG